jgi:HPt (histidine-containing phosphotransfer) domain-containing protein
MREMFIENGFNDYLSKPVDVSKLDEILNRWIPEREGTGERGLGAGERDSVSRGTTSNQYRNSNNDSPIPDPQSLIPSSPPLPAIPHVDTAKGIAMLGGKPDTYRKVLSMFCKDIDERLPHLQTMPEANTLPSFIIQVHSLKSVSASIGAQEVSSNAAGLEAAGKAADMVFIREHLPDFTVQLAELEEDIRAVLSGAAG